MARPALELAINAAGTSLARRLCAAAALLCSAASLAPAAHAADDLELRLKAAFLFNFVKFVTWPAHKFESPQAPFELCVAEPDPLGAVLDEAVRGKRIGGRPLVVRRVAWRIEQMQSCHLVYAPQRDGHGLAGVLEQLPATGVMSVHESEQPAAGGVVRLFQDGRRMRIEINTVAAAQAGLQLSSQLLAVAELVQH